MKTIEYRTDDKSNWPPGPWHEEPDKKQWQDEETGYPCLIVRNRFGALCGYVGVPEGHRYHGQDYYAPDVDCHGGLTYADHCQEGIEESHGICHLAEGEDKVWWFGFDCAHLYDICPARKSEFQEWESRYRDFGYVTREVASLARQLKGLS